MPAQKETERQGYSRRPDGGNIPYIVKSAIFTPEEARIVDDNIVLFKMANQ